MTDSQDKQPERTTGSSDDPGYFYFQKEVAEFVEQRFEDEQEITFQVSQRQLKQLLQIKSGIDSIRPEPGVQYSKLQLKLRKLIKLIPLLKAFYATRAIAEDTEFSHVIGFATYNDYRIDRFDVVPDPNEPSLSRITYYRTKHYRRDALPRRTQELLDTRF